MAVNDDKEKLFANRYNADDKEYDDHEFEVFARKPKGVPITWKDLSVIARVKKTHVFGKTDYSVKHIIKKVSGVVQPGNLVAILGASGSGKSTLMSVLASRNPGGLIVDGEIRINQQSTSRKIMKRISGYVYQDDIFVPYITVMEHMTFIAQLKLDRRISTEQKKQRIMNILTDLGLKTCLNSIIIEPRGTKIKANLSGGELRRLSVAIELLTDPPLLFCDEPTTGLDSFSAFELISVLKNLALKKNKTIICSIHQPSEQIFQMFHQIILMNSGKIAFIGTQEDAVSYVERFNFRCTEEENRAEFLVKSLSVKNQITAELICDEFHLTDYAKKIRTIMDDNKPANNTYKGFQKFNEDICQPYWIEKLFILTYRMLLQNMRNRSAEFARLSTSVVLALLIGICVRGSLQLTQPGVQALQGALFLCSTKNFFPYVQSVANNLPKQMPIFHREYGNETNTPLLFLLSNIFAQLPGLILSPSVFLLVFYLVSGLITPVNIAIASGVIMILLANTSAAFGTMFSVLFDTPAMSSTISVPIETTFLAISGIYISLRNIPPFLIWIEYISWFKYSVEALFCLQFQHIHQIACSSNPRLPCVKTGRDWLANLGFNANNIRWDVYCIVIIYFIMYITTFISLTIKMKRRTI